MLKKFLALGAALALALTLSACGGAAVKLPALTPETASAASGTEAEVVRTKPDASKYEDTLLGLMTYMEDGKAVVRDTEKVSFENGSVSAEEGVTSFVQMSYKEIGAVDGYRYQFTYGSSTVQAEFYEFDPQNLNDKAKGCVGSVSEKGFFQILGNDVKAVLHPSEKYMMIYTDSAAEKTEANKAQKEWAQELFLSFGK